MLEDLSVIMQNEVGVLHRELLDCERHREHLRVIVADFAEHVTLRNVKAVPKVTNRAGTRACQFQTHSTLHGPTLLHVLVAALERIVWRRYVQLALSEEQRATSRESNRVDREQARLAERTVDKRHVLQPKKSSNTMRACTGCKSSSVKKTSQVGAEQITKNS